jgi:hypothetical protein
MDNICQNNCWNFVLFLGFTAQEDCKKHLSGFDAQGIWCLLAAVTQGEAESMALLLLLNYLLNLSRLGALAKNRFLKMERRG